MADREGAKTEVALLAKQCMSQDPSEMNSGLAGIYQLLHEYRESADRQNDSGHLIRTLQELVAYKKGCVVRQLLTQVSCTRVERNGVETPKLAFISLLTLFNLAAHKLIARYIIKEAGPLVVLENMVYVLALKFLDPSFRRDIQADKTAHLFATTTEGLFYFARASKEFRTAVHEAREIIMYPLQHLLRKESLEALSSPVKVQLIIGCLSHFMAMLTAHEDSREWILEWGWLDVFLDLLKVVPLEDLKHTRTGSAVSLSIYSLLADKTMSQKLRAMNALALFQPFKEKIDACEDDLWLCLEGTLLGEANLELTFSRADRIEVLAKIDSRPVPVVCSWPDCDAGPETYSGKKYKTCSGCSLAAYCSKEHQSLDWSRHKKSCRDSVEQGFTQGDKSKAERAGKEQ